FSPFAPQPGLGGLNAVGGLQATQLQYGLIEREFEVFETAEEEDTTPVVVNITHAPPVNEDDLRGEQYDRSLIRRLEEQGEEEGENEGGEGNDLPTFETASFQIQIDDKGGQGGEPKWVLAHQYEDGNDPFDTKDHEEGS